MVSYFHTKFTLYEVLYGFIFIIIIFYVIGRLEGGLESLFGQ